MPESFGTRPVGSVVSPCGHPPPARPAVHWIEIRLVGEDGSPVPGEEYAVVLPDGTRARGYLDDQGFARVENITTPGTCRVFFPGLDAEAWD